MRGVIAVAGRGRPMWLRGGEGRWGGVVGSVGGWLAQRGEACDEFRNRWRRRPGHPTRRQPCVSRDVRTFKEEEEGGRCRVLRPGSFSCSTKEFTLLMYSRTCVCLFLGCVCVFPGFLGLGKAWKGLEGGMDSGNRIHYHGKFQEARGDTNTERDMIIIQTCLYFSDPCKHRLSIPVGPLQLYVFSPFAASNGVVVGLDKSVYLPSAAAACKMCEWCNSRCNSRCWLRCPCPPPCPRPPGL